MLDVARNRTVPPSLLDPPEWLAALRGFEIFAIQRTDNGWSAWPEGMGDDPEFPGGTWRAVMVMPVDLSVTDDHVDPLLLLNVLANGLNQVESKLEEVVAHCRTRSKSWTEIGRAIGITKQAAWERFSGED